jgi:hypothetical protein
VLRSNGHCLLPVINIGGWNYMNADNLNCVENAAGEEMFYVKMPIMIFILASGYLFSIYLLLALAKRSSQKTEKKQSEISLTGSITEVVNGQ